MGGVRDLPNDAEIIQMMVTGGIELCNRDAKQQEKRWYDYVKSRMRHLARRYKKEVCNAER